MPTSVPVCVEAARERLGRILVTSQIGTSGSRRTGHINGLRVPVKLIDAKVSAI